MCGICNIETGITSLERKTHAKTHHGYPSCPACQRVIKNLSMFEQHLLEPHEPEKCVACDEMVPECEAQKHAIEKHGFPTCPVCDKTINSNFRNFMLHLKSHEVETPCSVCNEMVPEWNAQKHAIERHQFPKCPVCDKTINSNFGIFYRHLMSHEVETPCPVCNEIVRQKDQEKHGIEKHGFPMCPTPMCSRRFRTVPLLYDHLRTCVMREPVTRAKCPLCTEMICLEKSILLTHLTGTHGFRGGVCQKCNMDGFVRMSPAAIFHHLSNCYDGKKYLCSTCHQEFKSLYFLKRHYCLPPDTLATPIVDQLQHLHGRLFMIMCGDMWMLAEWNMIGYARSIPRLILAPGLTPFTSFTETVEEAFIRKTRHGRAYRIHEDSRIFNEQTNRTVPLIYRFMGPPYERGNSLMPHVKLALVHQFKSLPPTDLWVFIVSRLESFTASARELDAFRQLLRVVPLPHGVDPKYRDLNQIRLFAETIKDLGTKSSPRVQYICQNEKLSSRPLIEELQTLDRAINEGLNVNMANTPARSRLSQVVFGADTSEERVNKRKRFNNGEINMDGSTVAESAIESQRAENIAFMVNEANYNRASEKYLSHLDTLRQPFHVADNDPCVSFDVDAFLDEREMAPQFEPRMAFAENPPEFTTGAEAEAADSNTSSDRALYLVFRDILLHFVTSRSIDTLRLFSNFFNEEPTWVDLTEMLHAFEPFISRDKATGGIDAFRASLLESKLKREILFIKNLYYRGTNPNLSSAEMIRLDRQTPRIRRVRIHRYR